MRKKLAVLLSAGIMITGVSGQCTWAMRIESQGDCEKYNENDVEKQKSTLCIGSDTFSGKFSPFFAETTADQLIMELTQTPLFLSDRSGSLVMQGIEGEDREYEGTQYHYEGIGDVTVDRQENTTVCSIRLRDDVLFADGEKMTADDLIFTYYVFCDTDYNGGATLYASDIQGLEAYRMNSSAAVSVPDEEIAEALSQMPEQLAEKIRNDVMKKLLQKEYVWAGDVWEDYAEDYGVENAEEFFALCYSTQDDYSVEGKDAETVREEILQMYGSDYKALAAAYGDDTYLDVEAAAAAKEYLLSTREDLQTDGVDYISGIRKISDLEVEITMDGYDASQIAKLGVCVAPLHYYGDEALYDYENHSFGFTRGDLTSVREKSAHPMGAGAYQFESFADGTVTLTANENYWKGTPDIDVIRCVETDEQNRIEAVSAGDLDIAMVTIPRDASGLQDDSVSVVMTGHLGYGYIGINAQKVYVGNDPGSEQSKSLRKALAVLIAACREAAVDAYYGDGAKVIEYPVCTSSSVSPSAEDEGYEAAYSRSCSGEVLYTETMTDEQRKEAALQAALEYFENAGYTVENGKIVSAPAGADMVYTAIVPGSGKGSHPCYQLLMEVSEILSQVGFTLRVQDAADSTDLWNARSEGKVQIWAAAWVQTSDPDLYQMYHSQSVGSNFYHIADQELDEMIMTARAESDPLQRKSAYKKCFDRILDWAVEIPVYERKNCLLYSTQHMDGSTFTQDMTEYYDWYREIEKIHS